jgi:hypothetical protein
MANSFGIAHCRIAWTIQIAFPAFFSSLPLRRPALAMAMTLALFRYFRSRSEKSICAEQVVRYGNNVLFASFSTGRHGERFDSLLHQQAEEEFDRGCQRFQRRN